MAFAGHQFDHAAGANEKDIDLDGNGKIVDQKKEFADATGSPDGGRVFQPPPLVRAMSPERRIEAELALKRKIGALNFFACFNAILSDTGLDLDDIIILTATRHRFETFADGDFDVYHELPRQKQYRGSQTCRFGGRFEPDECAIQRKSSIAFLPDFLDRERNMRLQSFLDVC